MIGIKNNPYIRTRIIWLRKNFIYYVKNKRGLSQRASSLVAHTHVAIDLLAITNCTWYHLIIFNIYSLKYFIMVCKT
jgi:hypothetical protein